jgi:hypothetical protein
MSAPLQPHHQALIAASAISSEVASARGYRSVTSEKELAQLGFSRTQRLPGLVFPVRDVNGNIAFDQLRPDKPRLAKNGKAIKYETPYGAALVVDVPPAARADIRDPMKPLWITEGARKADSAVSRGLCCISLNGVYGWRGTNKKTGKTVLACWESIALNGRAVYICFDSDVTTKPEVAEALRRLRKFLESKGATVTVITLPAGPGGSKVGLDDFFAAGHGVEELLALATNTPKEPEAPKATPAPADANALPVINISSLRLSEKSTKAYDALVVTNQTAARIYQQGASTGAPAIVRLRLDGDAPSVEALTPDALRGELDRTALWQKGDPPRPVDPPMAVVRDILSLPQYLSLPQLRAVAEAPFFAADGRLIVTPGYHPDAGVYLRMPHGLVVPPVPPEPSAKNVKEAIRLIHEELLVNFPFADNAHRAGAVGLLVLGVARELVLGPTPLHGLDAPMPASGKGLLAKAAALISTGRPMDVMSEAKDNEELRKRVTAILLAGARYALFDNVKRKLYSGVLAALLTTDVWSDRILGASRMVRLPVTTTWLATGNNLEFSEEIRRRVTWIRLDAVNPEPHRRTGFRHHPFEDWVLAERGTLIWALLVLVQNWLAQERPRFTERIMGSYTGWAETIGGILSAAGVKDFLGNADALAAKDDEAALWHRLIVAWWTEYGTTAVDVGTLMPLVVQMMPTILGDGGDRSQSTKLGLELRKKDGVVFKLNDTTNLRLTAGHEVGTDKGARSGYRLEPIKQENETIEDGRLGGAEERANKRDLLEAPNLAPNGRAASAKAGERLGIEKLQPAHLVEPEVPDLPTSTGGLAPAHEALANRLDDAQDESWNDGAIL